jgi:serine/threonine-protein kinase
MRPAIPFPPGTVLAGKYRVEALLGEGGMGSVVLATHLALEQRVALKFIHGEYASEPEAVARFLREAQAAARIQSEHVARVSDFGKLPGGEPYLVMEYLDGCDLDAMMQETRGPLPIPVALDYAMQACEGLAEAHAAGIVHRDLKPGNLFLAQRSDGSLRVKLLDFGISKLAPAAGQATVARMTRTQGGLMGSPLYSAPEQLRSSKDVDVRADIWSMGIILYEMLGGFSPFLAATMPEVLARIISTPPPPLTVANRDVSPLLEAVVLRCLEKAPEDRFANVGQLASALAAFGTRGMKETADRIRRVVGERSSGAATIAIPEAARHEVVTRPGLGAVRVHETRVAFGTVATSVPPPSPPRRASRAAVILASGLTLVVAALIALVAARSKTQGTARPAAGTAGLVALPEASPSPSAVAIAATASTSAPPLPIATSAPAVTAPVPAARRALPPRTKPTATHATEPDPTSGFGGRN